MTIAGIGVGAAGSSLLGGNNSEPDTGNDTTRKPAQDVPETVEALTPLASDFNERVNEHFEATVYITDNAEIAVEYQSNAESKNEFQTEMYQIADLFATSVADGDYDAVTLTVVSGEVQAIAPEPTVTAYVNGEINKEAYLETIEVKGVERNNNDG